MSTTELIDFYKSSGKDMFEPSRLLERVKYFYTADPLKAQLQEVFGRETNLEPDNLKCLLLLVTKDVTTDSPWPISSHPDAKYNDLERDDCNAVLANDRSLVRPLPVRTCRRPRIASSTPTV